MLGDRRDAKMGLRCLVGIDHFQLFKCVTERQVSGCLMGMNKSFMRIAKGGKNSGSDCYPNCPLYQLEKVKETSTF